MASNRKFTELRLFDTQAKVRLPKVKMTNGVTISLFDPYCMDHAKAIVDAVTPLINSLIIDHDYQAIVVPATKPIPLAWFFAYKYGLDLVVLKKEKKPYHTKVRFFTCKSLTSDHVNRMFITEDEYQKIKGKQVLFFDDVLSTGATYRGSKKFLKTVCRCTRVDSVFCFKEGDSYKEGKEVHYAGRIPLDLSK